MNTEGKKLAISTHISLVQRRHEVNKRSVRQKSFWYMQFAQCFPVSQNASALK